MADNLPPRSADDAPLFGHYIYRGPSPLLAIIVLVGALVLIGLTVAELRHPSGGQATLSVAGTDSATQPGVPVIRIGGAGEEWQVNGQPIADTDRLFRLSSLAVESGAVVIEYPGAMPAADLANAVQFINGTGFTQIGLKALVAGE